MYATYGVSQFYLNANAAIGFEDYRTKRPGVLTEITAEPSGQSYSFEFDAGYTGHFGSVTAGPVAGIDIAQVDIGAYTESGDPAINLAVGGQHYDRNIANLGVAAQSAFSIGGIALQPQASLTVNDLFSGNGGEFTSSFTDEPLVPLTTTYVATARYWGYFGAGLSASVSDRLSLAAKFETTFAKSDGNEHAVSASLRYMF